MSVPAKQQALVKTREGEGYELTTMDVAEPQQDEVLIRVEAVSICGSDIVLYKWTDAAKKIAAVPFVPGHEAAGTVVKAGPEATLKVGDRVGVENHFFCGSCYQCRHDRGDICQDMGQYGHGKKTQHGGCSQYSIVRSKYCYKLTTDISMEQAALLEPLGVAHNALEQCEVRGEDVLIIGCGPIGLMGCSLARALGATRVLAADIDEKRLELAKAMGADVIINTATQDLLEVVLRETGGDGVGRVCEMSGAMKMINAMFPVLRKAGHVVMVGLPKETLYVENPMQNIVFKSLTLRTVHGRRIFHTWRECERLLAEGAVDVGRVVTHRLPLSRFDEAFDALFGGQACKIVMDPQS